jgi:hypothetical protein
VNKAERNEKNAAAVARARLLRLKLSLVSWSGDTTNPKLERDAALAVVDHVNTYLLEGEIDANGRRKPPDLVIANMLLKSAQERLQLAKGTHGRTAKEQRERNRTIVAARDEICRDFNLSKEIGSSIISEVLEELGFTLSAVRVKKLKG